MKGRFYFKCPDKHGVFVPLRKVSPVQGLFREKIKKRLESITSIEDNKEDEDKEEEEEEVLDKETEDDMRITVRSFKAPQRIPTTTHEDETHHHSARKETSSPRLIKTTNNSCSDSGVESPTEHNSIEIERIINQSHKAHRSPKKNIVVSSFIAESPKKPVLFKSFDEDSGQQSELPTNSVDDALSKDILNKTKVSKETTVNNDYIATPVKLSIDSNGALSVDVFVKEANSRPSSDKPSSDETSLLKTTTKLTTPQNKKLDSTGKSKNKTTNLSIDDDGNDEEDGTTKIPLRVSEAAKLFESKNRNSTDVNNKKEAKTSPSSSSSSSSQKQSSIKPTTTSPVKRISRLSTPTSTTTSKLRQPTVPLTRTNSTRRKASFSSTTEFSSSPSPSSRTSLRLSSSKSPSVKASSVIQRRSSTKKSDTTVYKGKVFYVLVFFFFIFFYYSFRNRFITKYNVLFCVLCVKRLTQCFEIHGGRISCGFKFSQCFESLKSSRFPLITKDL